MSRKIFLIGFMGSGKTFWGRIWAQENQLSFFDLDEEIEKITGESVADLFEKRGEHYFRNIETKELKNFAYKDNFLLACGGGTPCFVDNLTWMNLQGTTIYLQADAHTIFKRIMNETQERPLLNKLNPSELLFFIEQKLKEREVFYLQAKHIVNVGALTTSSLHQLLSEI